MSEWIKVSLDMGFYRHICISGHVSAEEQAPGRSCSWAFVAAMVLMHVQEADLKHTTGENDRSLSRRRYDPSRPKEVSEVPDG